MIPSPADLTYFVEIASAQNVSRAAERLGISQPSLSLAMQRLEHAVGDPLFVRSKRGVTLTPAGKQLLAHARSLLQTWENVRSEARASVHEIKGAYTIGCHPSMAMRVLSAFLPELAEKHPRLDIRLRHDISRRITEDVISMKADIGIVVNPVRHADLVIQKLTQDEVTFFTAEKRKYKSQDIHSGAAILVCDPDLVQSQVLLRQFRKKNPDFARTITTGSLEVAADMVAQGLGIGILPSKVAERARAPLRRLPNAPVHIDEHCLVYRAENRGVKSVRALCDAIKAAFAVK